MDLLERAIQRVREEYLCDAPRDILDRNFPKQADFIADPARRKALWCTRRSAKSYTAGLYLAQTAITHEECNCLYLGLTRLSAKGIIWKDILKTIDKKHELGFQFNGTELTSTAQNGSMIYVTGVDADEDEMHKLLGKKWKLVIIDEAQSYSIDLRALVDGVLGPALIDQDGTACLMGTAGNLTQGLFYDVTKGRENEWKLFQWTAHDNPYVARQWQAELEKINRERPKFKETSLYKQWYLNQWVIDEDAKVYKFDAGKNTALHLPRELSDWHYVLGLDLAHSPDSTAFVVGAYHEASPTLYLVHASKAEKMDITDVALRIQQLDRTYKFDVKVVDSAAKQAIAELNNRHGLNLIPTQEKSQKAEFIRIMNDDFIQGKIALLPDTKPLQEEYQSLIWVTDASGKVLEPRKEHPTIHNDCADSALYLWRHCYSYLFQAEAQKQDMSKQEFWEPKHIEKLSEQVRREQNPNELDLQWNETWDNQWNEESGL